MSILATIKYLNIESKKFSNNQGSKRIEIFFLLVFLYFKSKFSDKNQPEIKCKIDGLYFSAYDYPSFINLFKEIFLEKIYDFRSKQEKPLIIDCGANIGLSVLYFKKLYPDARILAFEPNPKSFRLLQKNIDVNQLTGIETFQNILSDKEGQCDFYFNNQNGNINSTTLEHLKYDSKIMVERKLLSSFVKGKSIDLIKIDIEGDEIKVVEDLKNHGLISNVKEYIVEFHQRNDQPEDSLLKFISIFEEEGFSSKIIKSDLDKELGKNILLHFSKN